MKRSSKAPTKKKASANIGRSSVTKLQAKADKRAVDELVFLAMQDWACSKKGVRHILSLPGREWLWERSFTTAYPDLRVHFHGLEWNKSVWQSMSKMASKLDQIGKFQKFTALPIQTDCARFLSETEQRFDMIHLDSNAPWSDNTMRQVEIVLCRGLLKRGGLLRITTCLRNKIRGANLQFEYSPEIFGFQDMTAGEGNNPQWAPFGTDRLIMRFGYELGLKISIISSLIYVGKNHSPGKATTNHSVLFRLA